MKTDVSVCYFFLFHWSELTYLAFKKQAVVLEDEAESENEDKGEKKGNRLYVHRYMYEIDSYTVNLC